jgi:hypothetical protein
MGSLRLDDQPERVSFETSGVEARHAPGHTGT